MWRKFGCGSDRKKLCSFYEDLRTFIILAKFYVRFQLKYMFHVQCLYFGTLCRSWDIYEKYDKTRQTIHNLIFYEIRNNITGPQNVRFYFNFMFIYKIFNKYNLYRQNYFLFFFVLIPEHELQDQHQKKNYIRSRFMTLWEINLACRNDISFFIYVIFPFIIHPIFCLTADS